MKLVLQSTNINIQVDKKSLKWSVWNDKIPIDDHRYVLFNTKMRNAVLIDNSEIICPKQLREVDVDMLYMNGFLVDADFDEKESWGEEFCKGRDDMAFIDLTILLTENCQMRCQYCFEGTKVRKNINESTIDDIMSFLRRYINVCKRLRVT